MTVPVRPCTEASECRSCKALILWVEWPSGKKMPIDVGPVTTGNVVVAHSRSKNKLLAEGFNQRDHTGRRRFVSHFTTCPKAAQHRRSQ